MTTATEGVVDVVHTLGYDHDDTPRPEGVSSTHNAAGPAVQAAAGGRLGSSDSPRGGGAGGQG